MSSSFQSLKAFVTPSLLKTSVLPKNLSISRGVAYIYIYVYIYIYIYYTLCAFDLHVLFLLLWSYPFCIIIGTAVHNGQKHIQQTHLTLLGSRRV